MSKSESPVFAAVLLYSKARLHNPNEQNDLSRIMTTIQNDSVLSQTVHLVCIDNPRTRDYLIYNKSGCRVHHWPMYVLKYPGQQPKCYTINYSNQVFDECYSAYQNFVKGNQNKAPHLSLGGNYGQTNLSDLMVCPSSAGGLPDDRKSLNCMVIWNADRFSGNNSRVIYVRVNDSVRFKSSDGKVHDLVEATSTGQVARNPRLDYRKKASNKFDYVIKFETSGTFYLRCTKHDNMRLRVEVLPSTRCDHVVKWNATNFPEDGSGVDITVRRGDVIRFQSDDAQEHTIHFSNSSWKSRNQIVSRQINLDEHITVSNKYFHRLSSNDTYYMICSFNSQRMRVKINVEDDDSTDAIENMTESHYDTEFDSSRSSTESSSMSDISESSQPTISSKTHHTSGYSSYSSSSSNSHDSTRSNSSMSTHSDDAKRGRKGEHIAKKAEKEVGEVLDGMMDVNSSETGISGLINRATNIASRYGNKKTFAQRNREKGTDDTVVSQSEKKEEKKE